VRLSRGEDGVVEVESLIELFSATSALTATGEKSILRQLYPIPARFLAETLMEH